MQLGQVPEDFDELIDTAYPQLPELLRGGWHDNQRWQTFVNDRGGLDKLIEIELAELILATIRHRQPTNTQIPGDTP